MEFTAPRIWVDYITQEALKDAPTMWRVLVVDVADMTIEALVMSTRSTALLPAVDGVTSQVRSLHAIGAISPVKGRLALLEAMVILNGNGNAYAVLN